MEEQQENFNKTVVRTFTNIEGLLLDKDTKVVVIDEMYILPEDLTITPFNDDYIIQIKKGKIEEWNRIYRYFEMSFFIEVFSRSLIKKELNIIQLKDIPEWFNRNKEEAEHIVIDQWKKWDLEQKEAQNQREKARMIITLPTPPPIRKVGEMEDFFSKLFKKVFGTKGNGKYVR